MNTPSVSVAEQEQRELCAYGWLCKCGDCTRCRSRRNKTRRPLAGRGPYQRNEDERNA